MAIVLHTTETAAWVEGAISATIPEDLATFRPSYVLSCDPQEFAPDTLTAIKTAAAELGWDVNEPDASEN